MLRVTIPLLAFILLGCQSSPNNIAIPYSAAPVTEATLFAPGTISTPDNSEFDIMFSPDGRKAYFTRRAPEEKQKIYQTSFKDGTWTPPEVCRFSTDRDETPSITPDGEYLFFGSERPIPGRPNQGGFDMNIWMMSKTQEGWSTPEPLPAPINEVQIVGEEWPSSNNNFFSALDDHTFYYTTMVRGDSTIRLYKTSYENNNFTPPIRIDSLFEDAKYWIYSPVVSPDGQYLIFNSYGAPGGSGGEDIYVAQKTATGWSRARSIGGKVNSKDEESAPRFSRDGKYFFFNRTENLGNYEYGEWSIFFIETASLELDKIFQ